MSITFIGPSGSCEFPWIQYALLRDNVLHHFERRGRSEAFRELHRIAEALGDRRVTVLALRMREQLARAQALCILPVEKLAISAQTKAILFSQPDPRHELATEIIGSRLLSRPWLSNQSQTLGDVFGNICSAIFEITHDATESDVVEVIDG